MSTTIAPLGPKKTGVPETVIRGPPGVRAVPSTTTVSESPAALLPTTCPFETRETGSPGLGAITPEGPAGALVACSPVVGVPGAGGLGNCNNSTAVGFAAVLDTESAEDTKPAGFELGGPAGFVGRFLVEVLSGYIAETVLGANIVMVGYGAWIGAESVAGGMVAGAGLGVGIGVSFAPATGVSAYGGS